MAFGAKVLNNLVSGLRAQKQYCIMQVTGLLGIEGLRPCPKEHSLIGTRLSGDLTVAGKPSLPKPRRSRYFTIKDLGLKDHIYSESWDLTRASKSP